MDSWLTSTFQISRIMLSCCHNNVIMNKDLFASLVSVLWGIYSDVEFLDQMQIRFLRFWRATILFSSTAAPFDIPTSSTQDFSLSTSLPRFILFSILLKSHINCYEVKPHCGLFCMFLLISNVEHPFLMCLLAIVFFCLFSCWPACWLVLLLNCGSSLYQMHSLQVLSFLEPQRGVSSAECLVWG